MASAVKNEAAIEAHQYRTLAEFRHQIRRFLRQSEEAARAVGLEPQQYQLILAVKGMPEEKRARVAEIAERLQIQHHSAVELVDRMSANGFVSRKRSPEDKREVLVALTSKAERLLRELSFHHQAELREHMPALLQCLRKLS